jgi:hypothetical protein
MNTIVEDLTEIHHSTGRCRPRSSASIETRQNLSYEEPIRTHVRIPGGS